MALLLILPNSALAISADDILGVWVTVNGKSHVEISKANGHYAGKIIWLKEPLRNGKPKMDDKNPEASLRSKALIGLMILQGFVFKNGEWVDGKIYNPEDGKTYSCQIKLQNAKSLEVRGFVMGMPAFGKSQIWTRK
ncbi:DUF2147 domain-containing protein [bacterium (Candidatus Blackallbacteria) CG17_big_fil_post_rev_8_21_14_2_50_48_46]|uniref:DUF2147 domain-containing protein n=1 Tax=bacterium (Candidatus Blackallbacteria) CG17_big_fil_post_rev_8_21_14_2_50_48_46 TaxID=2014261 RepID=A0A2M7FXB8_9BACT|nr:MAG: SIGNAL peptide protein [bacterium (Candidatus Blackallbacteria) CG18_big_fil_WC_8_21_14_2_50_49_26]PIW13907.1 MAG: DUF2147 domain-containing protein [bacterium (Candidatus Blackallbacteria) CG17_big_fil_post_rev_8_21_14_2_50_48_46]PIW45133.1 MAG: DUF2147 domain-containing protein [bacterium (Candidatus Blackallbacteria) CG13_big_fil_rev_8_21_14_2_50_49_14]